MHGDPHLLENKVKPETNLNQILSSEKKEKKKGKFYKVKMFACSDDNETISVPYAIYYFYTAPVTKFWIYLVS